MMYWILYRKNKNNLEFLTKKYTWVDIEKITDDSPYELMPIKSWPEAKKISVSLSRRLQDSMDLALHSQPLLIKNDGTVASEDEMRVQIMADVHEAKLGQNSMERLGVLPGDIEDKFRFYI